MTDKFMENLLTPSTPWWHSIYAIMGRYGCTMSEAIQKAVDYLEKKDDTSSGSV